MKAWLRICGLLAIGAAADGPECVAGVHHHRASVAIAKSQDAIPNSDGGEDSVRRRVKAGCRSEKGEAALGNRSQ